MRVVPCLVLLLLATSASALEVSHSGFLLGASDQAIDTGAGTQPMTFAIYPTATLGTAAWTGTCDVAVRAGYYAVRLGDGTCGSAIGPTVLPLGAVAYLEVTVGTTTLQPRAVLGAAPTATNAQLLGGLALADLDTRYAKLSGPANVNDTLHWNGSAWAPGVGGTVTSISAGTGLTGGPITSAGTLAVNVGTGANQIPQLDATGKLASTTIPTITNAQLGDGTINAAKLATSGATTVGQVLGWTGSAWAPKTDVAGTGTVTSITAGTGLTGGTITGSGTLAVNVGQGPNQIPQLDGNGALGVGSLTPASYGRIVAEGPLSTSYTALVARNPGGVQVNLAASGAGADLNVVTNHPILLYTNNTERLRVEASGRVGIGTSAPTETLSVGGNISVTGTVLSQHVAKDLIGGTTGTYTGSWSQTGSVTDGVIDTMSDAAAVGATIEWTLGSAEQWALNANDLHVTMGGYWWPSDVRSGAFAVEIYNSNTASWVTVGNMPSFGTYSFTNTVPYNNPPFSTKVRVRCTTLGTNARIAEIAMTAGSNPFGWLENFTSANRSHFGSVAVDGTVSAGHYTGATHVLGFSTGATQIADGLTRWFGIAYTTASYTDVAIRAPISGSISRLFATTPGTSTGTRTYTLVVNGVDTALTCAASGSNGACSDTTHAVNVNANDSMCVKVVTSGGSNTVTHNATAILTSN